MIASIIQTSRKEKGMSLGILAERAGINKSTLSRWESGKTKPHVHELACVLDVLGITDYLRRQCLQQIGQPRSERDLLANHASSSTLPVSGGELLRALRIRVGFTQTDAARRIGVTQSLLSRWEHNDCWPDAENLYLLCQALGATRGECQGLREYGWKNHEELPLDKEELDAQVYRLKIDNVMPERDLIYLAFASRYTTLHRQRKINALEAMEAWGSYANYLTDQGRDEEAVRMATPVLEATLRSSGMITPGQFEALFAITDTRTTSVLDKVPLPLKQQREVLFSNREMILRFKDRIPASLMGRWQSAMGTASWHCGRKAVLPGQIAEPTLIAESDAYYEHGAQRESGTVNERARRQRFARILCFQDRFEEALRQLERASSLPVDTRIGRQVEYEQVMAWAMIRLGEKQVASRHLNQANYLLSIHPIFLEREDSLEFNRQITSVMETGKGMHFS
jgi:transcriptional regulator with XRE-family HTH domain